MDALENSIFTHILTNDTIVLQEGAREIYLKNVGTDAATFTGNKTNIEQVSTPVTLGVGERFAFGETGQGYKEITIVADATPTTSVEIVAIY